MVLGHSVEPKAPSEMKFDDISPQDLMYRHDPEHYFRFGKTAVKLIRHALFTTQRTTFNSILDLPCGHGRVLRSLRAEFPRARLTACDIDRNAVDFCAETFGAESVYSSEDPSELDVGQHDLIWCGSLFTHLKDWDDFLRLFERSLVPRGILVFTTAGRAMGADGFRYVEYPDEVKGPLGIEHYGTSYSSLSWVLKKLEDFDFRILYATEKAWHGQDVIACFRRPT
jgi:SAM-dependent methyltransferase